MDAGRDHRAGSGAGAGVLHGALADRDRTCFRGVRADHPGRSARLLVDRDADVEHRRRHVPDLLAGAARRPVRRRQRVRGDDRRLHGGGDGPAARLVGAEARRRPNPCARWPRRGRGGRGRPPRQRSPTEGERATTGRRDASDASQRLAADCDRCGGGGAAGVDFEVRRVPAAGGADARDMDEQNPRGRHHRRPVPAGDVALQPPAPDRAGVEARWPHRRGFRIAHRPRARGFRAIARARPWRSAGW